MSKTGIGLLICGTAAMVGAIFACAKTSKEPEEETTDDAEEPKKEDKPVVKRIARSIRKYWITIGLCTASIICFVLANHITVKAAAGAVSAYQAMEHVNQLYRKNVEKHIGEKEEAKIRYATAKDLTSEEVFQKKETLRVGNGDTLVYDVLSKQKIRIDITRIRRAEESLNGLLKTLPFVPINALYQFIGMKKQSFGGGIGWNKKDGEIKIGYHPVVLEDGQTCIVLMYNVYPHY